MMILVVLGTLEQKEMGLFTVQEKYFSAWIVWFWYLHTKGELVNDYPYDDEM